jgi:hypothetical protein
MVGESATLKGAVAVSEGAVKLGFCGLGSISGVGASERTGVEETTPYR